MKYYFFGLGSGLHTSTVFASMLRSIPTSIKAILRNESNFVTEIKTRP